MPSTIRTIYRILNDKHPYFYEIKDDPAEQIEIFYYAGNNMPTSGRISINRDDAGSLFEILKKMLGKGEYD